MGEKIKRLPYCENCFLPMTDDERCGCMTHWRPQTGTKVGFPKDGWNCPKDSFGTKELKEILERYKRAIILLKATSDILEKLDDTPYVLSFFEQTAVWDEVECDGYCLMEEINDLLEEMGIIDANER